MKADSTFSLKRNAPWIHWLPLQTRVKARGSRSSDPVLVIFAHTPKIIYLYSSMKETQFSTVMQCISFETECTPKYKGTLLCDGPYVTFSYIYTCKIWWQTGTKVTILLVFREWIYVYENVTYGPSHFWYHIYFWHRRISVLLVSSTHPPPEK